MHCGGNSGTFPTRTEEQRNEPEDFRKIRLFLKEIRKNRNNSERLNDAPSLRRRGVQSETIPPAGALLLLRSRHRTVRLWKKEKKMKAVQRSRLFDPGMDVGERRLSALLPSRVHPASIKRMLYPCPMMSLFEEGFILRCFQNLSLNA